MQITLVQTQIEEAIRQFVGSRLNLQIGETLDLDLRATRGDDGYTCVVTINTIATVNTSTNTPYTSTRPLNITESVENARIDEAVDAEPVQESAPESEDEPEAIAQTEAQVTEPATKKKSIFAGLEKPTNTSNADNEAA